MERRDVLVLKGKVGEIAYEELTLEGLNFYVQRSTESLFSKEGIFTSISPLYTSFKQVLEYCKHPIFDLEPDYIDPTIWNELSECYMGYCEESNIEFDENENWALALGISSVEHVYEALDSLGVSKDDATVLCDIICKILMDDEKVKELNDCLKDPFAFEGGVPGARELLLMLANQVQG